MPSENQTDYRINNYSFVVFVDDVDDSQLDTFLGLVSIKIAILQKPMQEREIAARILRRQPWVEIDIDTNPRNVSTAKSLIGFRFDQQWGKIQAVEITGPGGVVGRIEM